MLPLMCRAPMADNLFLLHLHDSDFHSFVPSFIRGGHFAKQIALSLRVGRNV